MRKNRIVSLVLVLIMCMITPIDAAVTEKYIDQQLKNEIKEQKIDELLDTISSLQFETKKSFNSIEIKQINRDLKRLGVQELSTSEVNSFLAKIGEKQMIPSTRSGNTVKWYTSTFDYWDNGTKYNIKRLRAVGNSEGGMLVNHLQDYVFYSNAEKAINVTTDMLSIYVQKGIGQIPIIGWLPYELAFSNNSNNKAKRNQVSARDVSTIMFTFIKRDNQSDDYYTLTKYSNRVKITIINSGMGYEDGEELDYYDKKSKVVYSPYFYSSSVAFERYKNNNIIYDYISHYTIYSYNKEYSKDIYLPNPLAGPGQIY